MDIPLVLLLQVISLGAGVVILWFGVWGVGRARFAMRLSRDYFAARKHRGPLPELHEFKFIEKPLPAFLSDGDQLLRSWGYEPLFVLDQIRDPTHRYAGLRELDWIYCDQNHHVLAHLRLVEFDMQLMSLSFETRFANGEAIQTWLPHYLGTMIFSKIHYRSGHNAWAIHAYHLARVAEWRERYGTPVALNGIDQILRLEEIAWRHYDEEYAQIVRRRMLRGLTADGLFIATGLILAGGSLLGIELFITRWLWTALTVPLAIHLMRKAANLDHIASQPIDPENASNAQTSNFAA